MNKFLIGTSCFLSLFFTSLPAEETAYMARDFASLFEMPGWSQDLLRMHLTLYQGYVKNTNLLLQEISNLSKQGQGKSYEFGALKRRFGWEFDGMRLHELYFENLTKDSGKVQVDSSLLKLIEQEFGSFEAWKQDFISTGLIRGIGWVILYKDRLSSKLCNVWINEHDVGHLALGEPLLVMDVFEHAYITQFALDRGKYIDLFFQSLNWGAVNQRWLSAQTQLLHHFKTDKNDHKESN